RGVTIGATGRRTPTTTRGVTTGATTRGVTMRGAIPGATRTPATRPTVLLSTRAGALLAVRVRLFAPTRMPAAPRSWAWASWVAAKRTVQATAARRVMERVMIQFPVSEGV